MPFRLTYEAIREMILRMALTHPMPRDIVRKSGLRPGTGTTRPRTVIDTYVDFNEPALLSQWSADLTGYSQVRFTSQSFSRVYVWYSHTLDGSYDPGDYAPLEGDDGGGLVEVSARGSESSEDLRWLTLPVERRAPIRLTLSASLESVESDSSLLQFSAALQVL